MASRSAVRIDFLREDDGCPFAQSSGEEWRALSGLLTSDVDHVADVDELIGLLLVAADTGGTVDETGNAFSVEADSVKATIEYAISADKYPPVHLTTLELVELLEAWRGFLVQGAPTYWDPSVHR